MSLQQGHTSYQNSSAFPSDHASEDVGNDPRNRTSGGGLTKREYFAAKAMQGLLAHPPPEGYSTTWDFVAQEAVRQADLLIDYLNNVGFRKR